MSFLTCKFKRDETAKRHTYVTPSTEPYLFISVNLNGRDRTNVPLLTKIPSTAACPSHAPSPYSTYPSPHPVLRRVRLRSLDDKRKSTMKGLLRCTSARAGEPRMRGVGSGDAGGPVSTRRWWNKKDKIQEGDLQGYTCWECWPGRWWFGFKKSCIYVTCLVCT